MKYYISFINHQDPNALGIAAPLVNWPQWTSQNQTLLNLLVDSNGLIEDNFRQESFDYIEGHRSVLVF